MYNKRANKKNPRSDLGKGAIVLLEPCKAAKNVDPLLLLHYLKCNRLKMKKEDDHRC